MKIAVNTRLLLKDRLEGIGRFSYEVLKRLAENNPQHEFYFIFDRPYDDSFIFNKNVNPIVVFPPARHAFLFVWWFEWSIPRILKKIKPDIFFSPDGYVSLRTKTPTVQVIHDLNFVHFPKNIPFFARYHYLYFFPKFARKAQSIISVSHYTKKDIINLYNINPEKIVVAWNGISDDFFPCTQQEIDETRKRFSSEKPYWLYVGSLHPRKNIGNLLKAFEIFKEKTKSDFKLLIAGKAYWGNQEMEKIYNNIRFQDDVIFTGRVNNEDLRLLYASSFALTYVSFFEGFGLPIAEAMKCNIPVICSNTTSMPEVGGDSCLYIDPKSPESIAESMEQLFSQHDLRLSLIEKGKIQHQQFNWNDTVKVIEDVFNSLKK